MIDKRTDRPAFLWDEPLTRDDLEKLLASQNEEESLYYAAKILREARFEEVWNYLSPDFLAAHWEKLRWRLGRRKKFWEFFCLLVSAIAKVNRSN